MVVTSFLVDGICSGIRYMDHERPEETTSDLLFVAL
jgi:hypothetical protein